MNSNNNHAIEKSKTTDNMNQTLRESWTNKNNNNPFRSKTYEEDLTAINYEEFRGLRGMFI